MVQTRLPGCALSAFQVRAIPCRRFDGPAKRLGPSSSSADVKSSKSDDEGLIDGVQPAFEPTDVEGAKTGCYENRPNSPK